MKNNMKSMFSTSSAPIWDFPLRLFHWLLVLAVIGAIASGKTENWFIHEKMGLAVLGLVGFRLIWGFIGGHHARFVRFPLAISSIFAYLRLRWSGDRHYQPGHAPTGAWATLLILVVLGSMAISGSMANNDILFEGPLAAWAGDFSNKASDAHDTLQWAVFGVIVLHLLAIVMYRVWLKIKLTPAMVTGGVDHNATPISLSKQIFGVILLIVMVAGAESLALISDRFYF